MRNSLTSSQMDAMSILSTAVAGLRSCGEHSVADALNRLLCDYVKECTDAARAEE